MNTPPANQRAYERLNRMLRHPDADDAWSRAHRAWLFQPGLAGLGFGQRMRGDRHLPEAVLIVFVNRKRQLPPESAEAIPRQIRLSDNRLVPVDVQEQATATTASARFASIRRRGSSAPGRVTTWVRLGQRELLLTCRHVLEQTSRRVEVLLNAWSDVGQSALLSTLVPNWPGVQAEPDQALFTAEQPGTARAAGWPRYSRASSQILASGSLLNVRHGRQATSAARVIHPAVTQWIGHDDQAYQFADLIMTNLASIKGDSGCPVEDSDGNLVGYVLADTSHLVEPVNHFSLIQPIAPVLKSLGCRLPPASSDPAFLRALGASTRDETSPGTGSDAAALLPDPRDVDVMARTLWGEARREGAEQMAALAHLIRNRLLATQPANPGKRTRFGRDASAICRNRSAFPCWASEPDIRTVDESDPEFRRALETAHAVLSARLGADPTRGATHQHRAGEPASWRRPTDQPVARIGEREYFRR